MKRNKMSQDEGWKVDINKQKTKKKRKKRDLKSKIKENDGYFTFHSLLVRNQLSSHGV
jgi:hypothetical protein